MDAAELLAGDGVFVVDTSSWWRVASLPPHTRALVQDALREDRFRITPIVRMEILYSARSSAEYVAIESELDALRILRNDSAVADAAMGAVGELAARSDGYHRVPLTDALIAAAAAEHGGLAVMHDDLHLQTIRNWIDHGVLPAVRVGRAFRVRREDVDALLERASAESSSLATRRDVWTPTTTSLPRSDAHRTLGSVWERADAELPVRRR